MKIIQNVRIDFLLYTIYIMQWYSQNIYLNILDVFNLRNIILIKFYYKTKTLCGINLIQ